MTTRGDLEGDATFLARLAADGIRTVADVLARSKAVRDLPDRSNHALLVGSDLIHVKRSRAWGPSREARAIGRAREAGVPVARIVFEGRAARLGSVVGTLDLAPARPLDEILREGTLEAGARAALLAALADAVAALHRARWTHRDLYLNHVYADPRATPPTLALIDLERMRRHRGVLGPRVVKDLAAIESSIAEGTVTDGERARFLVRYLRGRSLPVRSRIGPLAARVARKAARIRSHVPRTPVGAAGLPP